MRKENRKEAKAASKEAVAKEIVKRLHVENKTAVMLYKAGFFDFARYVQAGGSFAEIKEMMITSELPAAMKPARRTKKQEATS